MTHKNVTSDQAVAKAVAILDEVEMVALRVKEFVRDAVKAGDKEALDALARDVAVWKEMIE